MPQVTAQRPFSPRGGRRAMRPTAAPPAAPPAEPRRLARLARLAGPTAAAAAGAPRLPDVVTHNGHQCRISDDTPMAMRLLSISG